jgi:hypothetical protein
MAQVGGGSRGVKDRAQIKTQEYAAPIPFQFGKNEGNRTNKRSCLDGYELGIVRLARNCYTQHSSRRALSICCILTDFTGIDCEEP